MKKFVLWMALISVMVGGVYLYSISTQDASSNTRSTTPPLDRTPTEELPNIKNEDHLKRLIKERMKEQEFTIMEPTEEAASADTSNKDSAMSDTSTSDTNVQVQGIDEGDIVKTDGEFVYFARDDNIVIASTSGSDSKVVSTIKEKAFYPQELYLHQNYLISIGYSESTIREQHTTKESDPTDRLYPTMYAMQTTVYIYDISNTTNPKQIREFTMEGSLTASRKSDGYLYLVANHYPPISLLPEKEDVEIRPFVKDTAVSTAGEPIDYEEMFYFPESNDNNFMLLSSIDLNNIDKEASVETYLGASNQLYMSKNHVYTAVNRYHTEDPKKGMADTMIANSADTEIIQFKIDKEKITFHASTIVNGTLINQFAMDERGDTFRVATTKNSGWQNDVPSTNNVYTFDLQLHPLGKIEGLAEGERIYSVRFMEDVAYMVTFRQMDPLFVIDLKDAKNPKVLGELKIPGFSNYLHPLDDNHVIGFGQHTELRNVEWSTEPIVSPAGFKLSLFDVSDPANPKEKFTEILGEGNSYSEINYNHKALYKHPDENLFGFPAYLFETKPVQHGDDFYEEEILVFEGAFLYDISPETGFTLKDSITHQKQSTIDYGWDTHIHRMVSVGDMLYTLSYDEMKVYDLGKEQVLETVDLND